MILALLFAGCTDDFLFPGKVKTSNGITIVSDFSTGTLDRVLFGRASFVKNLTINDTINARDFKFMRDEMQNLEFLDLRNAVIDSYTGYEGTAGISEYYYQANTIPQYAFYNPEKAKGKKTLKKIIFPNTIKSIGNYAFTNCGLSETIDFPETLRDTIGRSAFAYCENLTSVKFASTACIEVSAFQGCESLSGDIVFPDSVFTIKAWAFAYCVSINSITLPATLIEIEQAAFNGCSGNFTVNSENQIYSAKDGVLYSVDGATLIQCPASKAGELKVPNNVVSVGPYAFANCTKLTNVVLPEGLMFVEDNAFWGCKGLTGDFFLPSSLFYLGLNVFEECDKIQGYKVNADNATYQFTNGILTDISQFTIKRCVVSKSGAYIIPSDIMFIDNSAFSNCVNITSITIPESVLAIGKRAFFNCTGLMDVFVKSATPIDLSDTKSAFELVIKSDCILHVPKGAALAYKNAEVWNEFGNIIEN